MGYTIRELLQKINDRDGVPSFQAACCGTPSLDEFILYQGRPEQFPAVMAAPVMVLDAKGDRLVFMLEIEDGNGSGVLVSGEVNKAKDSQNKPVNLVVSVYFKDVDNGGKTVPNSECFVRQAQKNLRYINTAKVSEWAAFAGVQFPFGALHNTRKKKY